MNNTHPIAVMTEQEFDDYISEHTTELDRLLALLTEEEAEEELERFDGGW